MVPNISIVVPVYNEKKEISSTIDAIFANVEHLEIPFEVIIVNDKSTDGTTNVLNLYQEQHKKSNLHILHARQNRGYGGSLKTGITHAKGEYIIITDADGTYPIKDMPRLIRLREQYDMVVGSRTGKTVNIPLTRRPAKWFLNTLSSFLVGQKIVDLNSGLRMFRKDMCLQFWSLYPEKFSFTSTITIAAMLNGFSVKYIPIDYFKRTGSSSIKPIDFARFFSLIIKILTRFNPIKMFSLVAASFALLAVLVFVIGYFGFNTLFDSTIAILFISAVQIFFFGIIADLIITMK